MKVIEGPTVDHLIESWDHRENTATSRCGAASGEPVERTPDEIDACERCLPDVDADEIVDELSADENDTEDDPDDE